MNERQAHVAKSILFVLFLGGAIGGLAYGLSEQTPQVATARPPRISRAKEVRVVAFTADWCATCRSAEPMLGKIDEIPGVLVIRCDVDNDPSGYADQMQVETLPTFLLYGRDRRVYYRGANLYELRRMLQPSSNENMR
jgi:thiol-disulfide isomerase/thioredoxin